MMNEKMVVKTAKSLNREKYVLEKLNKQIEQLQEKEMSLKRELSETSENLQISKIKEQEIKEANLKVKMQAEEEVMRNKKDHNELTMLREMKKNVQKELLGIGDWGLGIGDWAQSPIPNPQSPIP
jgi:hypothetical protein